MLFYKTKQEFMEGQWYQASTVDRNEPGSGRIVAHRSRKPAQLAWNFEMVSSPTVGPAGDRRRSGLREATPKAT